MDEKSARRWTAPELAKALASVGEVERRRGVDPARKKAYRTLLREHDLDGIRELAGQDLAGTPPVARATAERIVALALEHPGRCAAELVECLRQAGSEVEVADVDATLTMSGLGTVEDRLTRLQESFVAEQVELSAEQVALIEEANPAFAERHAESMRPGELLAQEHFLIGQLPGAGPVYLEAVVDTYGGYAFGLVCPDETPGAAAAVLHEDVLPFYARHGLPIRTIATPHDNAYTGPGHHPYVLYLALQDIERRVTSRRNGFVEAFRRAAVGEFLGNALAEKRYATIDELQSGFAAWLAGYNARRPQRGYRNFGKSPQAATDGYSVWVRLRPWIVIPARLSPSLGIGLWWLGVVVALRAQYLLTSNPDELYGAWRMAAAALIGLVGTSLIDRGLPLTVPPTPRVERPVASRGTRLQAGILAIAGLVALAVTIYAVSRTWPVPVQAALWVLALALVAAGVSVYGGPPFRLRRSRRETLELAGIVAIMALAFWLRFFSLRDIPLDVHGDEGAVGIEARRILSGEVSNLFGLGWAAMPELAFAASAASLDVFGNDLFGLRLASVIQGTLSVGLLYGIAKRLFPVRIALLAAFILAVSQMAIHYSRIGNMYIQALFASLVLFYFLLRGLMTHRPIDFLLAGFGVGLTASVYIAARLTPVIAVLYLLHRAISERGFLRQQWRNLLFVAAGALLFVAPQGVLYAREPGWLLQSRVNGVFVLGEGPLHHEFDAYQTNSVAAVLGYQFLHSLDAFNVRGESSNQYGQQGPLLDYWSAALFALGLALVTTRLRDSRLFLLASWFWLTLVTGSVLTVDAMFSPHIVGMFGVLALLPCLAVDAGWRGMVLRFGTWGKRVATVLVLAFAVLAARANYIDYFQIHLQKMEQPNFMAVLSKYVWTINDRYRVYLLAEADTSLRYDTAHFLIPDVDGVDVRDHPLPLPLDRIPEQKGVVFVVRDANDPRLAAIVAAYPRGVREAHYNVNGLVYFTAIRVERTDLIAAKPNAYIDHAPIHAAELSSLKIP